jgi:NAD(P)-dependent dehydrogenase (short-subunit alcohol dehydrogenase family)
VSYWYLN